ncbi:hypothetical protein MWU65_12805 [Cellulophaga sp. F20128]|uniref:tetratricopeptide repeat protein n=1 Tax=Cellulophaga sp. F20128 TaxID=2926413 RepID=UPI001FF3D6FC|nr:tetratricopeptide repeat protein [Cellulophaga sp. F20128]MCK0158068.1 hypothetical protein [Cellulophaga sp. F20128]
MKPYLFLILVFIGIKAKAQSSVLTTADSLYASGNYTAAINNYAKLGTTNASLQIARAYHAIGNYDKAIAEYKNVLIKKNTSELPRFELGKLLSKVNKDSLALSEFMVLIKNNPKNPEYFYNAGSITEKLGDSDKALIDYKKAVLIDSTHLRSLFRIGRYYVARKEVDSVFKYVDKGLRFYENDVSLINLKALAFFNNYQYTESIPLFERLIALGEANKAHIHNKLAYSYYKLYEFEKALESYRNVLKLQALNPDPTTYTNMAEVFRKDSQLDSAKVYVQKAIDELVVVLDTEYGMLAGIAREQNQLGEALKYYRLAAYEAPEQLKYAYQICAVGEAYYKDVKLNLKCYVDLKKQIKNNELNSYFDALADKRITELKTQISENGG